MSDVIWISTEMAAQSIETRLQRGISSLQSAGVSLTTEVSRSRLAQLIACEIRYLDESLTTGRRSCLEYISAVLADALFDECQPAILRRLLRRRYGWLTSPERDQIVAKALAQLSGVDELARQQRMRKQQVRAALHEYLLDQNRLNLDGFVSFRLQSYQGDLQQAVAKLVDQCLGAREDHEFVRLLQNFLRILEPKRDIAHLLLAGDAQFAILDEQGEVLRSDVLEAALHEDSSDGEYEDILISALLSIAPRYLVVHAGTFIDKPELLLMLRQVWQRRLEVCTDCDLCARLLAAKRHPDQG